MERQEEAPTQGEQVQGEDGARVWYSAHARKVMGGVSEGLWLRIYEYTWPGWQLVKYEPVQDPESARGHRIEREMALLTPLVEKLSLSARIAAMTAWASSVSIKHGFMPLGPGRGAALTGESSVVAEGDGVRAEYEVRGNIVRTAHLGPMVFRLTVETSAEVAVSPEKVRDAIVKKVTDTLASPEGGRMGEGVWVTRFLIEEAGHRR